MSVNGVLVNRDEHYADLARRLVELRALVADDNKHLAFFDEEIEANEFEIALHALCDFLLKANTPAMRPTEIEKIEALHERMELKDECAAGLRARLAFNDGGEV